MHPTRPTDKTHKPAIARVALPVMLLLGVILAGCHAPLGDDEIILAFTQRDTDLNPDKDPQRLADWIEQETGIPTRIYFIDSESTAIEALRFGHAHAAFMDGGGAWFAWQRHGFEVIAADQRDDGRTYYDAQAWVRNDSTIETIADFEGRTSCHTGLLKSAGMFMPLGYLIRNGYTEVVGDPDEITSIEPTARAFFHEPSIPTGRGDPFEGYNGAFRCMSEGHGEIALVRDTTWYEYCEVDNPPSWCGTRDDFRRIEPSFGAVPSHPVMVGPETSNHIREQLTNALLALNDSPTGESILRDVLETPGITQVTTQEHLGDYSANIQHVPGFAKYAEDQYENEATS